MSDPLLYEALNRIVSGVNSALTVPMAPSQPGPPSGVFTPSNPVSRLTTSGTIRTIGSVDFGCPLFLIAAEGPVTLETGGNIAAGVTVAQGQCCGLIYDATTGLWWPLAGASSSAIASAIAYSVAGALLTVQESDGSPILTSITTLSVSGATVSSGGTGIATLTIPSSSLTVRESDGSPSVSTASVIEFSGATVTNEGGGVARVTVGSSATPVINTENFTATASQTNFTLAYTPLANGVIYVTRDGVIAKADDWTLSTDTIIFDTGLDAGVGVQTCYWRTAPTGAATMSESFVATAGQTDFTLTYPPTSTFLVSVNGVVQATTAWSIISATTLQFVSGLNLDDDVWISYLYEAPAP